MLYPAPPMQLAEAEELEAAIAAEREEAEALRAQLGHLESQTAAQVWWGLLLSKNRFSSCVLQLVAC